jgi:hypothetical protein
MIGMGKEQLHRGIRCARANGGSHRAVTQRAAPSPPVKLPA